MRWGPVGIAVLFLTFLLFATPYIHGQTVSTFQTCFANSTDTCTTPNISVTAGDILAVGVAAEVFSACPASVTVTYATLSFTEVTSDCGSASFAYSGEFVATVLATSSASGVTVTVNGVGSGGVIWGNAIDINAPGYSLTPVSVGSQLFAHQSNSTGYCAGLGYHCYGVNNTVTVPAGDFSLATWLTPHGVIFFTATSIQYGALQDQALTGFWAPSGGGTTNFQVGTNGASGSAVITWALFSATPTPSTYQIVACTYYQLQCWTWPLLFTGMIVTPFMVVGTAARASPRGLAVLFMTTGMFALFTLVDTSTIDFVIPLLALVGVILFLLRSRPT